MTCSRCGHPDVRSPLANAPRPNPIWLGPTRRCLRCHLSLRLADHVWRDEENGDLLCCDCYVYLRDHPEAAAALWPNEPHHDTPPPCRET